MNRQTRTKRALLALSLGSALLLPTGCASSRNADHIELLHNELRLLEDVVYELEGEVKDKEQQVNAAKRENELIKEELRTLGMQRQRAALEESQDILPAAPGSEPPPISHPPHSGHVPQKPQKPKDMGTIEAPKIEAPALPFPMGNQGGAARQESPYRRAQYTEEVQYQVAQGPALAPGEANDAASDQVPQPAKRNLLENHWKAATIAPPSAVDHITIHPRLSGGHDSDRKPGHDGLQVIFAPRDASEQPLQVRGAISVVLVDPELKARSARWEYSIDEAQQFFKKSMFAGEAYHLDLRWPLNPPTNADQELHVRFTTADGQRHEASTKIILQLPGSKVAAPQQPPPGRRAEVLQHTPLQHAAPQPAATLRMTGTPTLAPPQDPNNDPPPIWTGPSGPSLTAPQMAAAPNYAPSNSSQPSINITVPDVGGVPPAGQDNQRLTIAQRLQQRRTARLRGPSTPSHEETGNLALPHVEAPALPGMSSPNLNVPNLNVPGSMPAQPQPAKASGWRSWFSSTPPAPTTTAPAYSDTAPAYPSPVPGARPEGFAIVPAPGATVPLNNAPGVSPAMQPPPQLAAPQFPNDASRTATKPEWKPYR